MSDRDSAEDRRNELEEPAAQVFSNGYPGGINRCAVLHFSEHPGELPLRGLFGAVNCDESGPARASDWIAHACLEFEARMIGGFDGECFTASGLQRAVRAHDSMIRVVGGWSEPC